tara:strand:+ start:318 stop:668 length:351 start_codon:yes stop_codon:yes gene_type:complete
MSNSPVERKIMNKLDYIVAMLSHFAPDKQEDTREYRVAMNVTKPGLNGYMSKLDYIVPKLMFSIIPDIQKLAPVHVTWRQGVDQYPQIIRNKLNYIVERVSLPMSSAEEKLALTAP